MGEWTFELYLFVIGYAVLLYLMSVVLLPDDLEQHPSFREYFLARRRWFFALLAATQVVDAFDTFAKGTTHAASLGAEYWIQLVAYFVLALVAAAWSSRWFHAAFAAVSLAYTIWFLIRVTTAQ